MEKPFQVAFMEFRSCFLDCNYASMLTFVIGIIKLNAYLTEMKRGMLRQYWV